MSANNYLKIHREVKQFVIEDLCADTGLGDEMKRTKGLKAAIEWAEEYKQNHIVEYGIHFDVI